MVRPLLVSVIVISLFACAANKEVRKDMSEEQVERTPDLPDAAEEDATKREEKVARKKAPPVVIERGAGDKYVILNFDNADIETVITTMGDLLNINYILAPGVSGKVTIQSYKKFPVKDLFSIFQAILEMNGLTAVKHKEFYIIMPIDTAKQQPLDVEKGKEVSLTLDSGFITQIVPLEYVKASDTANLLRGLMPRGTDLIVYEPTNLLIVTARPEGLVKFMKILDAIDIASSDRENIRTFVYYAENGEAKKLADILKSIYVQQKGARTTRPTPRRPSSRRGSAKNKTVAAPTVIGGTAGEIEGDVNITAYEDINALIIKSSPAAYLAILETLKKLDIPLRQVLIEVLVAEVTLNDDERLGIEWLLKTRGEPAVIAGNLPSGIDIDTPATGAVTDNYFGYIIDPTKFVSLISAFASYGKVNVLSSPHILALDNKEAKIEIGDEIPIATGLNTSATGTEAGTTLVSSGQIQYKTAGVILTVTPHISEKGNVMLKISQEFSGPGESTEVAGQKFPAFFTRKAQTSGIVKDGHTLVIGGLISENKTVTKSGFPILSKIPILGYLFGSTSSTARRTELLVMVTPHVIKNQDDADRVTKQFQEKTRTIKKRIERFNDSFKDNG